MDFSLGPALATQARLLDALLKAVEPDPRWEWLELGCSVADGRGDELSDLDLGLGFDPDDPPDPAEVTRLLRGLGPVVEVSCQPWEALDGVTRWWVQYADGGQIDLVTIPAPTRPGRAPRSVALLDRHGRLAHEFTPQVWKAAPDEPRQWLLDGWEALGNIAKYLRRGALLEAVEQLHRARTRVFQLWAVGEGVAYPSFGVTSLLDEAGASVPDGIEQTYALPDFPSVRAAALAAARLLVAAARHADPALDTPLREFVIARLDNASLPT